MAIAPTVPMDAVPAAIEEGLGALDLRTFSKADAFFSQAFFAGNRNTGGSSELFLSKAELAISIA